MNTINDSELLGNLGNLHPQAPAKQAAKEAIKAKTSAISTRQATGKAMYEQMRHMLPAETQQLIREGRLQLVDEVLYSVKSMNGLRDRELMESGDNKEIGKTNVDKQKIEANKWSLLVAIQLLSRSSASADFGVCDKKILNGEFELEVGNTVIVPNVSCTVFNTTGRTDIQPGMWAEFDPQFITPNTEIKPRLKLATEASVATAVSDVYFAMHVVSVAKN